MLFFIFLHGINLSLFIGIGIGHTPFSQSIHNNGAVANHHNIGTDCYCTLLLLLFWSTYFINVLLLINTLLPKVTFYLFKGFFGINSNTSRASMIKWCVGVDHAINHWHIAKVSQMNTWFSGYLNWLKLHPSCRKAFM